MAWQALHVRPTGEIATISAPKVSGFGLDTTISSAVVNAGAALTCYCCCPLPYDASYTNWVAVFTTPINGDDCPMHAITLLLAFKGSRRGKDAPPSLYLHFPVQQELEIMCPISLNANAWKSAEGAWSTAIKSLSTLSWLSYAFDGLWNLQTNKEVYQDADLLDGEEEAGGDGVEVSAVLPLAQKEIVDSSSYDEDMVDDGDEDVDAYTGMVTVRDESVVTSEEEYESDDATEEEEEDGEEEKDEGEEL